MTRSLHSSKRQNSCPGHFREGGSHAVLILLSVPTACIRWSRRLAFDTQAGAFRSLGLLNAWFTIPAQIDLDGLVPHVQRSSVVALISIRPGRLPTEQKAGLSVRSTESFDRGDIDSPDDLLERHFADVGWEAARLLRAARNCTRLLPRLDRAGPAGPVVSRPRRAARRRRILPESADRPRHQPGPGGRLHLGWRARSFGCDDNGRHSALEAIQAAFDRYESRMRPYVEQGPATTSERRQWVRPNEPAAHRDGLDLYAVVAALADASS